MGVDGLLAFQTCIDVHHDEAQFHAFDVPVSDERGCRRLPLSMRKASLARLLARRVDGIHLADFEQGEIGPDLFRHACLMGLEGIVSKRTDAPYRSGPSKTWLKSKNPASEAVRREREEEWRWPGLHAIANNLLVLREGAFTKRTTGRRPAQPSRECQ